MLLLALFACTEGDDTDTVDLLLDYDVAWSTDPSPPVAGEPAQLSLQVLQPDGTPAEGLQTNHERVVHTFIIAEDLTSFAHVHQEDDGEPLSADQLREARFSYPYTFPKSGTFKLSFDFAHRNEFLQVDDSVVVTGEPAMGEPDLTVVTEVEKDDLVARLEWIVPPVAGQVAEWRLHLTTTDGEDVTDIVQYLGADAHVAVCRSDLQWVSHTHAWVEGMDEMAPGMEMEHVYDGPTIDFQYGFPFAGHHKMWLQFTRASNPDHVYSVPFVFEVP